MSYFTDIVVVSEKEARHVARHTNPTGKWTGAEAKNLDEVTFGSLYAILLGDRVEGPDFDEMDSEDDDLLVSRFPEDFVDRLSLLDADGLPEVANQWSQTEDLRGAFKARDLEEILLEVSALAKKAKSEGKWLVLCTSG